MCTTIIRKALILLILSYQKAMSPLLPPRCRYHPTCSQYAKKACETMSLPKAIWYIAKRIVSCHPWSEGGFDPLPTTQQEDPHER